MDAKNPSGAFGRSTFVAYSALALSIGALVVGFIACWSLQSMVGRAAIPLGDPFFAWLGMALLMAGLFPLSAIAFTWMEVPGIVEQAKNDCKMLGADGKWNRYADPTASRYNPSNYALHYSLAIIATLMGVGLFFRDPDKHLSINTIQALRLGFLGAYLYCVGLIYRRYTTLDLQPSVYLRCAAGLISGLAFNYVAFTTFDNVSLLHTGDNAIDTQQRFTGTAAAVTAIVAFSLGYFPNLAIGWFTRISHTALQQDVRRSDALPLSLIDGISELHEARLRDQGIDNIQNLATATIRDLVLKTPFDAQEIVEWIDQAVLLLYLDPGEISGFRRAGARSVTDFADLWRGFCVRYEVQASGALKRLPCGTDVKDFDERRKAIAQQLHTTEERLDALYHATEYGPNMHFVRTYWNNVEALERQARAALVREVCGQVGYVVRKNERQGTGTSENDVLKEVVRELLEDKTSGPKASTSSDVTAASLCGQAWLNKLLGNDDEAESLYKQCIETFPQDPAAFNDLAWLILHAYQDPLLSSQALQYAKTAVSLASQTDGDVLAGYLDTLALAHVRQNKPEKALPVIDKALLMWQRSGHSNQPKFLETLVDIAEAFQAKGDLETARKQAERVVHSGYADAHTKKRAEELLSACPDKAGC